MRHARGHPSVTAQRAVTPPLCEVGRSSWLARELLATAAAGEGAQEQLGLGSRLLNALNREDKGRRWDDRTSATQNT